MAEYTRVICRDWEGMALDRVLVGEGRRVFYVAISTGIDVISTDNGVGFPKDTVFAYRDGVAGRKLKEAEWGELLPLREER
jgi:hypothetical protein